MFDGMRGPHAGEAVGLQFGPDALAVSSLPAACLQGAQEVLNVMPVFVGEDVGLGKPPALRTETRLELVEEPQVDVDLLVGRAVERAHLRRRRAARVWVWPMKNTVGTTV